MKQIISHQSYRGMPEPYKKDGSVRWVVSANSEIGKRRRAWWEKKRASLGIPDETGNLQATALAIHPTRKKPCQICGRTLNLDYVYPNKNILKRIHDIPNLEVRFSETDHIRTIIESIEKELGKDGLEHLRESLSIPTTVHSTADEFYNFIIKEKITLLGPGAMSDAPDRFDGFHTYNRCCRHIHDTGRHRENLARYGQDRRVYEFWADGDWKAADWLMRLYNKYGLSPDHIGPISLGFCHRPRFDPTTLKDNINKRNRLGIDDVKKLLEDERRGEQVVSWHSKKVWDQLKNSITSESEANELGKVMRKNLNHVLSFLHKIKHAGHEEFLVRKFLHPEHSRFSIEFEGFDPETGEYKELKRIRGDKKQYENNAKRYVRKSLEALDKYDEKENRRVKLWEGKDIDDKISEIITLLNLSRFDSACKKIEELLTILSRYAEREFRKNI